MNDDVQRIGEEVDAIAERYVRKIKRRHFWKRAIPGFSVGIIFGTLGNILARAWDDGRWIDVGCCLFAASLLTFVWWTQMVKS